LWRQGEGWTSLAGHAGPVGCLAWAPDSVRLATGEDSTSPPGGARVHIWDTRQGKELFALSAGKVSGVTGLLFTPDGRRRGVGWRRASGALSEWWDLDTRKIVGRYAQGPGAAWDVRFLKGGEVIAAHTQTTHVALWRQEVDGAGRGGKVFSEHAGVRCLAF